MSKIKLQKAGFHSRKPLLATALTIAGVLSTMSAVVAEGTPAGTAITNTATATYDDGNGTNINATSNTVTINVAEVVGIIAAPTGFLDQNGGAIEGTDTLVYSFLVTNTGNDATDVFIPGTANIITSNFDVTGAGSGGKVEIFSANNLTTPLGIVPPGGGNYSTIVGGGATIPANGQFVVQVTGKIAAGTTAGQPVGVTLGNVPPNDNTPATQNQILINNGNNNDLKTVDAGTITPGYVPREASASESKPFASANNPLALATVLKNSSVVGNSPTSATDDQITYELGLRVESVVPPGNAFQAAPLEGTTIRLNGTAQKQVLVSDAIPEGTALQSVSPPPLGWTAVYSTVGAVGSNPLATTTTWSTTAPANLSTVTRVGFVNAGPLAPGFSISGLKFTVVTSSLSASGGLINNLAQVFGGTVGGTPGKIVYDESGDQNPNNFENNQPGADYPATGDDGVARPGTDEIDPGGNNGTGPNGEVNQINILLTTSKILNGTEGKPGAVGPNNDSDDFTNKSTNVPAGIGPAGPGNAPAAGIFNPDPVIFKNTLSNPATSGFLSNVTLQPVAPSVADTATSSSGRYGANGDIPNGTLVTIKYIGKPNAEYSYSNGAFTLINGTSHINVGSVTAQQALDYTVTVQLPNGQPALKSVAIPIIAFPDDLNGSPGFTNETTHNITIDRVYTGFMSLRKQARVLRANGSERLPFQDTFMAAESILPGEFIEYKIDYVNISTTPVGTGNVTLNANNFVITEDGRTSAGNSWAATTTHQQNTQFKTGTTVKYTDVTGPTDFASDPASGTKVDIYQNTVGTVLPGPVNGGALRFRRRVN